MNRDLRRRRFFLGLVCLSGALRSFWGRAELSVCDDKVTALNMCLFEA